MDEASRTLYEVLKQARRNAGQIAVDLQEIASAVASDSDFRNAPYTWLLDLAHRTADAAASHDATQIFINSAILLAGSYLKLQMEQMEHERRRGL